MQAQRDKVLALAQYNNPHLDLKAGQRKRVRGKGGVTGVIRTKICQQCHQTFEEHKRKCTSCNIQLPTLAKMKDLPAHAKKVSWRSDESINSFSTKCSSASVSSCSSASSCVSASSFASASSGTSAMSMSDASLSEKSDDFLPDSADELVDEYNKVRLIATFP